MELFRKQLEGQLEKAFAEKLMDVEADAARFMMTTGQPRKCGAGDQARCARCRLIP